MALQRLRAERALVLLTVVHRAAPFREKSGRTSLLFLPKPFLGGGKSLGEGKYLCFTSRIGGS
jgi:hypothetical protein